MKISTKLQGSAVLIISIILIFMGTVLCVSRIAGQAGERNQIAQKILEISVTGVALRVEYSLTGEERPKVQWYALQTTLNNTLDQAAPLFTEPANQTLFTALQESQGTRKATFDALVVARERDDSPELISHLSNKLAVAVQERVNIATRLAELSRKEHESAHRLLNTATGVLGLFAILLALISYFVSRKISSSLATLQQDITRISALDFSSTTTTTRNDELGQLGRAFNSMTEKLRLKAEQLATIAKEKEEVRQKLAVTNERLVRTEKLAVLGKLAGIMGHEIRNPLEVIRNSIYFLTMKFGESMDEKVKRHMDILRSEIDGADKIISDILEFARTKPPYLAEAEINSVVEAVLSKDSIPKTVKVQTDLGENLPTLNIDRAQIGQVFSNIISNAIEAMPKGGELRVTTSQTGTFISIAFKDTGAGIPKENVSRLFEPLFSTKAKGLGLGLVACQNIISAHQGKIEFESKEGQGATFTVTLPIYKN